MNEPPAIPFRCLSTGTAQDATIVHAGLTKLRMLICTNTNAAVRYLKLYNKATVPVVGTDTPAMTFAVPGATTGDGFALPIPESGLMFPLGLGFALTTGVADTDVTGVAANELIVNGAWNVHAV